MRRGNKARSEGRSAVSLLIVAGAAIVSMASAAFGGIEPSPFKDSSNASKAVRTPAAQQQNIQQQNTQPLNVQPQNIQPQNVQPQNTQPQNIQLQRRDPGTLSKPLAMPDLECTISVGTLGSESICGGTAQMKKGSVQTGGTIQDVTKTPCTDNTNNTIVVIQGLKWSFKVKNAGPGATQSGKQIRVTRSISKAGNVESFPQETIVEVLPPQGFKDYSYPPAGQFNLGTAPAGLYKADMTVEYEGEEKNNNKSNNKCSHYFTLTH